MVSRPCLTCGQSSAGTYCPEHGGSAQGIGTPHARGYDKAWYRLSRRARRLQPFCEDCGALADLTTDHKPEAWERRAEGKPIRLQDVAVVCRGCNTARGSSRPGSARASTHGGYASTAPARILAEAEFQSHNESSA